MERGTVLPPAVAIEKTSRWRLIFIYSILSPLHPQRSPYTRGRLPARPCNTSLHHHVLYCPRQFPQKSIFAFMAIAVRRAYVNDSLHNSSVKLQARNNDHLYLLMNGTSQDSKASVYDERTLPLYHLHGRHQRCQLALRYSSPRRRWGRNDANINKSSISPFFSTSRS